jgi:uncharacterized protein (TIGR01777 family)
MSGLVFLMIVCLIPSGNAYREHMKIVITGGTGFLGRPLVQRLVRDRHTVVVLSRDPSKGRFEKNVNVTVEQWDAATMKNWARHVDGADAVLNFAGDSIGGKRWTPTQKEIILSSRINATRVVVESIARAKKKPWVLISASAVGYYGHVESGDVTEGHPQGNDFLAGVCEQWEKESRKAEALGVRVVNPRFGIVLAKDGGALKKLLLPFSLFIGGPLGSGRQWFPWVHRDDVIEILMFLIQRLQLSGPVNVGSPHPVTMKEFCKSLGRAMSRPSWAPVPSFVLNTLLGEMSLVVLTGQRVIPKKLLEVGYTFRYPKLEDALRSIFKE